MDTFHREYLVRLPLPLAQLYVRSYNAKEAKSRHDNTFYLFEALTKLAACPLVAGYVWEIEHGGTRAGGIDQLLAQLALPSLGQWVGMVRELAKYFGNKPDAASHPLGHVWGQLSQPHRDKGGMIGLYRRIKNGPDGQTAGDSSCSLMQLLDALVQYRNAVFGHGAGRFESFYEKEMGPLLFPALNEILAEGTLDLLGPKGTRLLHITEVKTTEGGQMEVGSRELVGIQGERLPPISLTRQEAESLEPNVVALQWPGRKTPLRLDPLLVYRESEVSEEVLFLNRDRSGKQVEYLSYTTGRTERDKSTAPALARLLSVVMGKTVGAGDLDKLAAGELQTEPLGVPTSGRVVGDYEVLAEIGRGGMGVVYLARQLALGRIVALKMLPAELAGDEVALARFQREMRALARCEHPNIVKVLGSGAMPDGQLYYTMEYVPGSDLEQVFRELSGPNRKEDSSKLGNSTFTGAVIKAARKRRESTERTRAGKQAQPSEGTGDLPQLPLPPLPELPTVADDPGGYARKVVSLLRDAASALQTVHEQQIVHRDVKPANLMLTPDGSRVVLMDFGLAKGQDMAMSVSKAGGFLGTLRYAAPEQLAAGTLKVGPQADVRGLGVVLWELLTRKRLFEEATDERELAQRVHEQDVPRLSSIDKGFDRDLEAIVARATERRVTDRIQSAGELAGYMQLWLEDKPLPIRPPTAQEMLLRWVREHKTAVSWGAAAVVAIVLTAIVAFVLITRSRNEAVTARKMETVQRQRAEDALKREAIERQRAEENFRAARNAVDEYMTKVSEEKLLQVSGMQGLRKELLSSALKYYQDFAKQRADDAVLASELATAWFRIGRITSEIASKADAEKAYKQAIRLRQARVAAEPQNTEQRIKLAGYHTSLGMIQTASGQTDDALMTFQTALDIHGKLAAEIPSNERQADLASSHNNLSLLLGAIGRGPEALAHCREALAIREKLVLADAKEPRYQRDLASALMNLSNLLQATGQIAEGVEVAQRALALCDKLAAADPRNAEDQNTLARAYGNVGVLEKSAGHGPAAARSYDKAIEIYEKLVADNPRVTEYRALLASTYGNLGNLQYAAGFAAEALKTHQKGLAIREKLAADNPTVADFQSELASAWNSLGATQKESGQIAEALASFQKAVGIQEKLVAASPDVAEYRSNLALSHYNLGIQHTVMGAPAEAVKSYQRALDLRRKLAADNPTVLAYQCDLAFDHYQLAMACAAAGRAAEVNPNAQAALDMFQKLAEENPKSITVQKQYKTVATGMILFRLAADDLKGALAAAEKRAAISDAAATASLDAGLKADMAQAYGILSFVQIVNRKVKEAIASAGKAVEADGAQVMVRANLAHAYLFDGQYERAAAIYSQIKDTKIGEKLTGADVVRWHFGEFRKRGASHPDMAKVEALLGPATRPAL